MRYFTLFSVKKIGQEISKTLRKFQTIFKNQYLQNNKNRPLAVLREEQVIVFYQFAKCEKY
jgi:hypothetical protein